MKKTVALTLSLITLIVLGLVCIQPVEAKYRGNILINTDGSITPSTAPIQRDGDHFILTDDVIGSLSILRSNATFNGNNHSLIALGGNHGIEGLSVGLNAYSDPPVVKNTSNVTVKNVNVRGSVWGLSLINASNSLIVNNTISETGNGYLSMDQQTAGIYIAGGASNVIKGNTLSNNYNGVLLVESADNLIVGNTIANCYNPCGFSAVGINFWGASNNMIYHNNFLNNSMQAYGGITIAAAGVAPLANNTWTDGHFGNYWSDYQTKYPDVREVENTGTGSLPYVIDEKNQDNHPLLEPFNSTLYAIKTTPPRIEVLTPLNQQYNESVVPLTFRVDKEADWMGYSLDGQANVTVGGNQTLPDVSDGEHTLVVYANDSYGNMNSQTISFTVSMPEAPVLPIAIILVISAVAIGVGLAIYFKKHRQKI
jgi:parallel beta-helix repeat protein